MAIQKTLTKMVLDKPVFQVDRDSPGGNTPDTLWWFWRMVATREPTLQLGGIYANKPGSHNRGDVLRDSGVNDPRTDYSIRHLKNRTGLGMTKASAIDITFPPAHQGNYALIDKYTSRMISSMMDPKDPRPDLWLFEIFGQADWDSEVEGYRELEEKKVSSDKSHLWHDHIGILRALLGNWWGAWATWTIWDGWSIDRWRDSIPEPTFPAPGPGRPSPLLPAYPLGSRVLHQKGPQWTMMSGTDVLYVQNFIGRWADTQGNWINIPKDGWFTEKTYKGVRWYQNMRGLGVDGIVGPATWAAMGVRR